MDKNKSEHEHYENVNTQRKKSFSSIVINKNGINKRDSLLSSDSNYDVSGLSSSYINENQNFNFHRLNNLISKTLEQSNNTQKNNDFGHSYSSGFTVSDNNHKQMNESNLNQNQSKYFKKKISFLLLKQTLK